MNLKKEAVWIWYPGDFEIALAKKVMTRRYEIVFIPPFWRLDDCYHNVKFMKEVLLNKPEILNIKSEGKTNVSINGRYVYGFSGLLKLPPGKWLLEIVCFNPDGLPAILVEGEEIISDLSWKVTCGDGKYVKVGTSRLVNKKPSPNDVRLPTEIRFPLREFKVDDKTIYDFGEEMMAYL
jgi:alpha-L-rhamnosidase